MVDSFVFFLKRKDGPCRKRIEEVYQQAVPRLDMHVIRTDETTGASIRFGYIYMYQYGSTR
jgi:hypothetical protein